MKKVKKRSVETKEHLESTRLVIAEVNEKPITRIVIGNENEVDMEILSSKQALGDDLHITSDEETDILTEKYIYPYNS